MNINDPQLSPDGLPFDVLPEGTYDPEWAMSVASLKHLQRILNQYKPKSILELGVGVSSHVCLGYAGKSQEIGYVGMEAWKPYLEMHLEALRLRGLPPKGTILIETDASGFYFTKLHNVGKFDIVVSDGPTGSRFCPEAQEFYKAVNTPTTIWVVDDSNRPTEGRLADWLCGLQDAEPQVIQDQIYQHRTTTFVVPKCLDQPTN